MNRVENAISKTQAQCKTVAQEKLTALHKQLDMQLDEYVKFQELKSLAMMEGKLSEEEAMTVYGYLGNTLEHFNAQSVAVKVVLTKIFSELLSARIRSKIL